MIEAIGNLFGFALICTLIFFGMAWLVSVSYPVRRRAFKQWLRRLQITK